MTGWEAPFRNGASQPDYIVYQLGSTIYASALTSGLSSYSGPSTDAGAVIQKAVNALKGVGGQVALKGTLTMNTGIASYPGIAIVGQGPLGSFTYGSSLLLATANVTGPVITLDVDPGNPSWVTFPYLANFTIGGVAAGTSQDGIQINNANGLILDCYIQNVGVFGLGGNGINSVAATKLWVDNCYLEDNQRNGLLSTAYGLRVTNSYIYGNALQGVNQTSGQYMQIIGCELLVNVTGALDLHAFGVSAHVIGNTIWNNGTHAGVYQCRVWGMSGTGTRLIIADNVFRDDRGGSAVVNHITCGANGGTATVIDIHDNGFYGSTGPAIIRTQNGAGDNYRIHDNQGYNDLVGQITNPVNTANNNITTLGTTATVVASTDYTIGDVNQYLVVSGGVGVLITVKDPAGNTVESGLVSLAKVIPIGFKVNFGAFSVAPTLASYVT